MYIIIISVTSKQVKCIFREIKILVLRGFENFRNTSDDVWLGMLKHSNSSSWYIVKEDGCEEIIITLPGKLFHKRRCAVLNMSGLSSSGNPHVIYAEACEGRTLGFV